jgi:hypothetical protein
MHYYSTVNSERGSAVGQVIMLGTLFGLIIVIFGLVMYLDPEASRHAAHRSDAVPMTDEIDR